jgi:hypothetical protein
MVGSTFPATNSDQCPVSLFSPGTYQVVIDPTTGSNDTGPAAITSGRDGHQWLGRSLRSIQF